MAQHEFTSEQNQVFDSLSGALRRFVAAVSALAALMIVYGLIAVNIGHFGGIVMMLIIVSSALALVMAWLFTRPLDNFRRITTQQGHDMSELGTALDDLSAAQTMFVALVALWVLFDVVGIFISSGR